ncbi:MAG: hypothetical protein JKX73_11555 [Flavobacteriales bacterium]|nr:hypothetical protein [Flavobacteriales bacterium]
MLLTYSCSEPVEEHDEIDLVDSVVAPIEDAAEDGFDAELAKKLGADEYGMASYVIAFLKKGPNRDMTHDEAMSLQVAHLDNIQRLADEGKLVVAGPFMDSGDLMGIYVFNVATLEEARELTATDPAIERGSLVMELHSWYGSAAMKEINGIHSRIMAKSVTE